MDIKELESGVDPNTHWYYQSKKIPLLKFINDKLQTHTSFSLIDIGAGSGFFSDALQQHFPTQIRAAYLVDTAYSKEEIMSTSKGPVFKQHILPEQINNSVLLLMDVLEHLEDDTQMLLEIKKHTSGDGTNLFFITVPAFQHVWSAHDVYLEHYRRYTIASLKALLTRADLKAERYYYLYGSLFPMVYFKRKLGNLFSNKNSPPVSDMKPVPLWLNTLLLKYSTLEMLFTKHNRLFGLSCVAEGRF